LPSMRQPVQTETPTLKDIEQQVEVSSNQQPFQSKMPTPQDIEQSVEISSKRQPLQKEMPTLKDIEQSVEISSNQQPLQKEMPTPQDSEQSVEFSSSRQPLQKEMTTPKDIEQQVEISSKRQPFQRKMTTPKDIEQLVEISSNQQPFQSKMPTPQDIDPSILHSLIQEPFHEKTRIMRQDNPRQEIARSKEPLHAEERILRKEDPSTKISSSTSSLGNSLGKEQGRKVTVTAGLNGDRGIVQKKTLTVPIPSNRPLSEIYVPSNPQSTEQSIAPINASVAFSRNMNREDRQSTSDEERSFAAKIGQLIASPQGRRNYEEIPSSRIGKASVRPRSELQETASSLESKSTIRVSIGRIDVRSENKAVPPPQETSIPAPRLSLDEYLKRRNEGHL
ncbi:MAG: hypothetical protein LUO89_14940, partial [Methanothrix sp.]|nr:hypothetical protein [Methanothrix sp.]